MKKIVSGLLTAVLTSSLVACQRPDNLNMTQFPEDNLIQSQSVLSPLEINEVLNGKTILKNMDSAVLVNTLSGGKIDQKNDIQKLSLSFSANQTAITNGLQTNINIPRSTAPDLLEDRHGQSETDYIDEINMVNEAYRSGRVMPSNRAVLNNVLKEGATRTFKLQNEETNKIEERTVILKKITRSGLFWVAKNEINEIDETVFENSANYWDTTAYPLVTKKFGAAPLPPKDIDGEARINIYIDTISKNKGLFGYFSPMDVVGTGKPQSNQADMLYLNSWMFKKGEASEHYAKSTLIHEFQHLVNFNVKVTQRLISKKQPILEDRWLNEGMSTYAEQLGQLGLPAGDQFAAAYLNSFFNEPGRSPIVTNDQNLNYGAVYLFVLYLVEQYGDSVLNKLTISDKAGIANVELITKAPFKKTFTDWATAILLSGSSKNPKFDFKTVDLHKTYGKFVLDGINLKNIVNKFPEQAGLESNNWSVNYIKLDNIANQNLNLNLKNSGNAILTTNLVKLK
jgi:hypothetical protein